MSPVPSPPASASAHACLPLAAALSLFLAFLPAACNRGDGVSQPPIVLTPVDSGVYRADMEGRRGLLLFSAHSAHMSFAFDTAVGGVFLAWNGPVESARTGLGGIIYHRQEAEPIWTVRRDGDTVTPVVRFLGFGSEPGLLIVRLALILPGGDTIRVRELLGHDDHYGDHALETQFDFDGIDAGTAVALRLAGKPGAGPWPPLWSASVGRLEGEAGGEAYVQDQDGVGQVKVTFTGSYSR